jgi:hypothetical protein
MEIERLRSRLQFCLARAERARNDELRREWLNLAKSWEIVMSVADLEERRLSLLEVFSLWPFSKRGGRENMPGEAH